MVKFRMPVAFLVTAFLIFQGQIQAVTYGSDTAVSIVNPMNIPASTDNIIKTFACAKNGFGFQNLSTTCSFQSIFPVAGPVSLKGGSLYLMSDLILNNTGTLADLGTIRGANHVLELSQWNTSFASNTQPNGNVVLTPVASTTLTRYSRSFDWSYDGKYLLCSATGGSGNELNIYEFTGSSLVLRAGVAILGNPNVNSVRWRPNSYYFAVAASNNFIRSYLFTPPSTITNGGTAAFITPYAVAFDSLGKYVAVGGTAISISIYSYTATGGGSFSLVTTSTLGALNGTVTYDALKWAPRGSKDDIFVLSSSKLHLYNFTGSALNWVAAQSQGKTGTAFDWSPTSTYIAAGFSDGTIRTYQHTAATNSILIKQSATLTGRVNSLSWKSDASELAAARASAAANEMQVYYFDNSSYALTERYGIALTTDAYCIRYYSPYLARSDNSTRLLTVYKESYSPFIFRDVNIILNNDLTLGGPLTFTGNCSIFGQNYKITFTGNGSLNVSPLSSLNIKNTTLNFTTPNSFSLQGGTSSLQFSNSTLKLKNDIFLTDGKIDIYDDLTLTGPYTFAYQSDYTSTIHANSNLNVQNGATFQIGKQRTTTIEPIYFENSSSQLNFDNATLHTTGSGLTIKRGTVNIFGNSTFEIDVTDTYVSSTMQGLVFGDGVRVSYDPLLILNGNGTRLTVKNGSVVLDAAHTSSMVQFYGQPQIALDTTSTIYIKTPLEFANGWIISTTSANMVLNTGAYLSVNNTRFSNPGSTLDLLLTGSVAGTAHSILDKNDSFNILASSVYQILDVVQDGNEVSGAGLFTGYINFAGSQSQLTWNAQTKLNSDIDLNGGRIIFAQDSGFNTQYSFKRSGTIDLTSRRFDLGSYEILWTGNFYWIGNGGIIRMNNDITLDGTWTLSGNIIIEGNGYSLDLGTTGTVILERGAQVTFNNFALYNITRRNPIYCEDNNCQITLNYTDLILADNFLFDKGSIYVYYDSIIMPITPGSLDTMFTFSYFTTQPCLLDSDASLAIWSGIRFSVGRRDSSVTDPAQQPIIFGDPTTSKVILSGGTLHVTSSGMIMTAGTIDVDESSNLEIENAAYPYGLILGDGIAADDVLLEIDAGVNLALKSGKLFYNNYSDDRINFASQESALSFEVERGLYAKRSIKLLNGTMSTPLTTYTITNQDPNVNITYENMHRYDYAHLQDYVFTGTAVAMPFPTAVLDSGDQILINPGTFNRNILIKQFNNRISGVGNISGSIDFTDRRSTLTWDLARRYGGGDINLKGGKIIYTQDSGFEQGYSFKGSGTIDFSDHVLDLGGNVTAWNSNIYWIGSNSTLRLNNNVTLSGIWTFSGSVLIEGNNYLIDFAPTGTIILERGATVEFKDVSLYNLSRAHGVFCRDNTCQVRLNFADMLLSDDFLFDKGGIFVYYDSAIGLIDGLDGHKTFSYESIQSSTIDSFAYLKILPGVTFSIGRRDSTISNPDRQPLIFNDPLTAKLILGGGTLHITSSGMILTRGMMDVSDTSELKIETPKYEYGLILGDGTVNDDFEIIIEGGYQLNLNTGKIFYNNYNPRRILFGSPLSSLNVVPIDGLTAKTNLTLLDGTIYSAGNAVAKYGNPSIVLDNVIREFQSPYSVLKFAVHDVSPSYKLSNGDFFYVTEGYSTKNVLADSGFSNFGGVAGFGGTLTLRNNTVTVQSSLETSFFNSVALNGGKFIFITNGLFAADKTLTGSGTVQFYGTDVSFGPLDTKMTNTIYWKGVTSGGINLNSRTDLYGSWSFGGQIGINGNGNVLDLSSGGVLTIRPNSTLVLENIDLKGLGSGRGSINFMDDTATLRLSNVYLELDNNMSTTIGGIVVNGPSVVGLKNYDWTLDQNASMTVDGVSLWQDPLDQTTHGKIRFGSGSIGKYLSLVSSGTIKTMTNLDSITSSEFLAQQVTNNSNAIVYWTPINRTTSNATSWLSIRVRTDSNAFAYEIRNNSNAIIKLSQTSSTLSVNNSNAIAYWTPINRGTSNSTLVTSNHFISTNNGILTVLGAINGTTNVGGRSMLSSPINLNGGTLTLGGDIILSNQSTIVSSGNVALRNNAVIFGGNLDIPSAVSIKITSSGVLDGQGNNLNIRSGGRLIIDNNVTLTLRNLNLLGDGTNQIEMRFASSKLGLQNVIMGLDRDFTFSQGQLFVSEDVVFTGTGKFSYASTLTSYIMPHTTLCFDKNTTFSYSPRLTGRHTLSERELISMQDKTSRILFDECNLQLPDSGWRLTKGSIYFDNKVTIYGNQLLPQGFEWGDGSTSGELDVNLLGGAFIVNNGYVSYNPAS